MKIRVQVQDERVDHFVGKKGPGSTRYLVIQDKSAEGKRLDHFLELKIKEDHPTLPVNVRDAFGFAEITHLEAGFGGRMRAEGTIHFDKVEEAAPSKK